MWQLSKGWFVFETYLFALWNIIPIQTIINIQLPRVGISMKFFFYSNDIFFSCQKNLQLEINPMFKVYVSNLDKQNVIQESIVQLFEILFSLPIHQSEKTSLIYRWELIKMIKNKLIKQIELYISSALYTKLRQNIKTNMLYWLWNVLT